MKISQNHLFAAILLICASSCGFASDIYISQNKAGSNTGASCADARALSSLDPSDWVPGNKIHLCGTITSAAGAAGIVAQGSGTSSQPITIKFEGNAVLQAPYFGGSSGCWSLATCAGGIEVYGQNYIIIDGGTNGIIQNTANGTDLTYQKGSLGVFLSGNNFIVRNLTIKNIYANDPSTGADWGGQNTSDLLISGASNVTVCKNTLANAQSGIAANSIGGVAPAYPLPSCPANSFTNGTNLFGNALTDHCWHVQPGGTSSPIVNIFNNDVSGVSNWVYRPNPSSYYHTDGVIAFGGTGAQVLVYLFNNVFHDTAFGTAAFYCTYGTTGSGCAAYIFNNVFEVDSAEANKSTAVWLNGTAGYPLGPYYIYNNTFLNNGYAVELAGDNESVTFENNLVSEGTTGYNYFYTKGYGSSALQSVLAAADYNSFYGARGLSFSGPGTYYCWPQSGGSSSGCGSSYNGPWAKSGFDTHSVSANPQINARYQLSGNSPDIRAGTNLSSLCGIPGLGPLCYDKNGTARPLTGAWDIGAFEMPGPNPPAGLTGAVK